MLSRQALAGVIEPRVEEIYSLVHQVIRDSGYEELLSSGIVICGGTSVMPGMVELGEDIFLKPVRKGLRCTAAPWLTWWPTRVRHRDGFVGRSAPGAPARAQGGGAGGLDEHFLRPRQDWFLGNF